MKSYLSYSLLDREEFIITLLSSRLKEKGFFLVTGRNFFSDKIDFTTSQLITTSQLFIGIVSKKGSQWNRVLLEWGLAVKHHIPNILLIEEGVAIDPSFKGNYVIFNRLKPQIAIDEINKRMLESKKNESEDWSWVVGGVALVALIALLTGGGKK